jgi:hypothetical protein
VYSSIAPIFSIFSISSNCQKPPISIVHVLSILISKQAKSANIYESNRGRSVQEVLDEARQSFQQLLATIEGLPDDVQIETEWRLVCLGDQRFPAGEFFDHFHDDHEPDVRDWLAQVERQ